MKPSSIGPEAWLLFIFRPKRINFIIHLLIIILIHYITHSDMKLSWEQIHLHNPAEDRALSICLSIYTIGCTVSPSSCLHSHISDRLTHFSSFTPEQTVPGGGGWPRHKAAAELTGSGVHLNGRLFPPRLPSSHYSSREQTEGMDGFHSNTPLPLVWSFKVISSRSIRLHWCMGKWITSVCVCVSGGGFTDTPAQGQTQCVISVPRSDTRCQWNAAQDVLFTWLYQCKILCFFSLHTVE